MEIIFILLVNVLSIAVSNLNLEFEINHYHISIIIENVHVFRKNIAVWKNNINIS